jgi:hypothetical protein
VAVKRILLGVAWYLSIGVAVGIETGVHQMARIDPGFDPLFTSIVTVFIWPLVLAQDLSVFVGHLTGALPRP